MGNFRISTQILLGNLMVILILLGLGAAMSGLLLSIKNNSIALNKDIIPLVENAPVFKQALQRIAQDLHGNILIEKEAYLAMKGILPMEAWPKNEADINSGDRIINDIEKAIEGLPNGNDSMLAAARIRDAVGQTLRIFFIGLALTILAAVIGGGSATRSVNRQIKAVAERLQRGVHHIDSSAVSLAETTMGLATGVTSNAASLNTTEEAVTGLKELTKLNSEAAAEAAKSMREARQHFVATMESVNNLGQAMNEISSSGQQIGKIIKTIDEIAFQTNLLALNAAVESARAGEAGAGFAVVADEVRNLAVRSAEAARSTNDLITKTVNGITVGGESLKKTEDTFNAVGDVLRHIGRKVTNVAETSKKQAADIDEIKQAMTQIGKVTSDNSATSENSVAAASGLNAQTRELMESINRLNVMIYSQKQIANKPGTGEAKLKQIPL